MYYLFKFSESFAVERLLMVFTLSKLLGGFSCYTLCIVRINFIYLCMKFLLSVKIN